MMDSRVRVALGMIVVVCAALRVFFILESAPTDDAHITYRYAEQLASGHGFVYNVGERVLGTTTPLFTLILVPFAWAGIPLASAAAVLAVLADIVVCLLLYRIFSSSFGAGAALTAALFYAVSYVAASACGYGMETQLFSLLVVSSIALVTEERYEAAGAATGLATLMRPEGILLAGVLTAYVLVGRQGVARRSIGRGLVSFVAVVLPWVLFATWYFGSPLPNSVVAKLAQRDVATLQWFRFFFTRNPLVVLLWMGAVVGVIASVKKRNHPGILLGVWLGVYVAFFAASRPPFLGGWYFPPAAMPLWGLSAVGSCWLLGVLLRRRAHEAAAVATVFAMLTVIVMPRALGTTRWQRRVADRVYRPLGHWVAANIQSGVTVHASDIGYLGYISKAKIMDAAALVTPGVRRFHAQHGEERNWDVSFVLEHMPEVVILPVKAGVYERFMGSEFSSRYRPVARFQVEGDTDLHPSPGVAERYSRDGRFMADFIVYEIAAR